jgi:hypothetical protein
MYLLLMLSTDGINTTAREEAGYAKNPHEGGWKTT